jgi:hypothetical protein
MALSLRPTGVPVTLPSPDPGRLADHQLLRLSGRQLYGFTVLAIRGEDLNSAFPAMLGELAIMLWLLIKGAKPQPLGAAASSLAVG